MHLELSLLPPLDNQINLLRTAGNQFDEEERAMFWKPLPGVNMAQGDGLEPALYDTRVVPKISEMIAHSGPVHEALEKVRPGRRTTRDMNPTIHKWLEGNGITLGFSGYGTGGGFSYAAEHAGIQEIFDHCKATGLPIDGVVDGATGYGVPGLSGALAQKNNIPTIGFAPLRSLRGAAPRDTYVVVGEEFGDEAEALGAMPDALIAFGGGPFAEKEVETAIVLGTTVILAAIKEYPESSAVHLTNRSPRARAAQEAGKLVVCKSISQVTDRLDGLKTAYLKLDREKRALHLHAAVTKA